MTNSLNKHKVTIFGEGYHLVSDETDEHIAQAGFLVDSLMREIAEKSHGTDVKKIAVLTALKYASATIHLKQQIDLYTQEQSKLADLIDYEFETLS